ncbi:MAG: Pre-mRNA-splicing factor ATP-dependent RNA helicase PRP16 [Marteilia pararefringens]
MPGQESIEVTCHFLQERLDKLEDIEPLLILPLFSQLPQDVQSKIFEKSSMRKCIVATNIAETSLTVDGIVYVIDTGYCKMKVFNPKLGMDSLQMFPISQANSKQRAGRAGRTKPGTCYHLYTMKQLNEDMLASPLPEIQRTNLSNVVLLLKSLGIEDLLSFHFMDPPPQENIMNSMYMLWLLGALSNTGDLTDLGRLMSEFPLDPAMAKLIIASAELGCAEDAIIICAMLSVPGIFYRPSGREDEADSAREKFTISESDHLTYLNVFKQWQAKGYSQYWCQQNFLHGKALKRAREVQLQLRLILNSLISHNKLHNHIKQSSSSSTQWDLLRQAICSAYFHNAAKTKGLAEYYGMRTGIKCQIHPTSSLYAMGCTADYVVFHELLLTSREFMQCVTEVDGEWLAKYGSILYSLKKTRTHGHNRVIDGQIVSGEDYNRSNESKIDLKLKEAEEELKRRKEEELLRERKINEKTKNKIISIHSKPRYLQR